ncbi:MAG TPA: phage portal protein [Candidatus Paceibacterota bacterium]
MASRETMGTNIDPGLIQRVSQGIRYAITGVAPDNFFGPSQPLAPVAQDKSEGRGWDYPVGVNLRIQPRNTEYTPFSTMRQLADGYDLLRLVIESRKDQIKSFDWEIVPTDEKATSEQLAPQIKAVTDFFQAPDGEHAWDDWLSMLVEDLLVIDAVAIYPAMNRGGKVRAFELIDAATITRKIGVDGRTPQPPDVAYQQIIHGIMANDLSSDELVYMMRNPRTNRLYGFSPVEQIIMTVNIALRRQMSQLEFYTSGNVPEAIAQVPDNWTPKQIADFQLMWDSMNEGNTAARRKMRFVPSLKDIVFPKKDVLKDEYDEWLARIVCYAFSISPTAFVKQNNRATAEQQADTAKEEGLLPLMRWLQNKMNFLISRHLGVPEVKFKWKMENAIDPLKQAQIDKIYVTDTGIQVKEEIRERMGLDALPETEEVAPEQKDATMEDKVKKPEETNV